MKKMMTELQHTVYGLRKQINRDIAEPYPVLDGDENSRRQDKVETKDVFM